MIRDDRVDVQGQRGAHLLGAVERPHVDLDALAVGLAHRVRRDRHDPPRGVERRGPEVEGVPGRPPQHLVVEQADALAHPGHEPHRGVVERRVDHPAAPAQSLDGLDHLGLHARIGHDRVLELDVRAQAGAGQGGEHVVERGDAGAGEVGAAAREVVAVQLGQAHVADPAVAGARPVDLLVVADDEPAVAGALHVELDAVGAECRGGGEGGNGVLGRGPAGAPVGPDPRHRVGLTESMSMTAPGSIVRASRTVRATSWGRR